MSIAGMIKDCLYLNKYMLLAGWEVRMIKMCYRGFENAARARWPRPELSSPRSQFFTIRTDPEQDNDIFINSSYKKKWFTSGSVYGSLSLSRSTSRR